MAFFMIFSLSFWFGCQISFEERAKGQLAVKQTKITLHH